TPRSAATSLSARPSSPTRRSPALTTLDHTERGIAQIRLPTHHERDIQLDDVLDSHRRQRHRNAQRQRWRIAAGSAGGAVVDIGGDRKSTRLNSSHVKISYAVFCLQ